MKAFLFLVPFLFTHQALALIEVRGTAGGAIIDSTHLNSTLTTHGIPNVYAIGVYGGDVLFTPPVIPLAFGIRYDYFNIRVGDDNSNNVAIRQTRFAALASLRFFESLGTFVGLIGSLGFSHQSHLKMRVSQVDTVYDQATVESSSGGLEIGFRIMPFLIGLEFGFQSYLAKDVKNSSNQQGPDMNLSGFYTRGLAGLSF
ncbi:MAG: hypothetical protein AB7F59_14325 [Bdellovibrionales bacterium]